MDNQEHQIIMLFGTFDHLHAGHENVFTQARALARRFAKPLIVAVVARDKTVKQIKSKTPDNPEKTRIKNLEETLWANIVLLGEKRDKYKAIRKYRPTIIALGYDQFVFTPQLEKLIIDLNLDTKIVRLVPYRPEIYKSSLIREKNDKFTSIPTAKKSFNIKSVQPVQK
ncbi:MAG: adenylyltransferase/cytidyltransferase family protein [Candidatus Gracilibacteria bacterium]